MKKFLSLFLTIIFLMSSLCTFTACGSDAGIKVVLDGKELNFDVAPVIQDGRTLVPLRGIFEALGASVTWEESSKKITAQKDTIQIELIIDKKEMVRNGVLIPLDTPPVIKDKRTLVPVRVIAESFNLKVDWNDTEKTVYISSVTPAGKMLVSHFLDVGQGDSAFIELPDNKCALIDAGERENSAKIISYIKNLGYSTIDYVICTHPHSDHIGAMADVINAFDISNIYMPKKAHTSKTYINLLTTIKEKGMTIKEAKSGVSVYKDDSIELVFVSPTRDYNELNDISAVLKLTYLNSSFLFTGDCENSAAKDIVHDIDVDVLKISHHGSSNATDEDFIIRTSPQYAVISCGEGNSYGHPHQETVSLLGEYNVPIYRTDLHGDIKISTDGVTISVSSSESAIVSSDTVVTAPTEYDQQKTQHNESDVVYITKTGKKYHRAGCSSLKNSSIETTKAQAEISGLTPCKICTP